jgi:3-oxoadipate enol-lactonase
VLLHGLGADRSVWDQVVPDLAREFRVLAPDLRGHGRSAAPAGSTFSFAEIEGDLVELLRDAQVERAHVVGLSAGGFVALRWALTAPTYFQSLTVVNGAPHCDNHTKAVVDRWAETYRSEGLDAYVLRLVKDVFYPDWVDAHLEIVDRMRDELARSDLSNLLAWTAAVRSFDLRGRLMKVTTSTRILQSMDDSVVDGSHGRLLRVSIPGADLKLFPQSGHLLPLEKPVETAEAIREMVRSVENRSPSPVHP